MMAITQATADILNLFDAEGLHRDLSIDQRVALAAEIATLEARGYVVDLATCQILEDVSPDQPVGLQPATPANAGGWN